MVMLKVGLFDATGLFVEIKRVPREERRRIIDLCSQGCTAIVRGVVAPVLGAPGLVAERVEIP